MTIKNVVAFEKLLNSKSILEVNSAVSFITFKISMSTKITPGITSVMVFPVDR